MNSLVTRFMPAKLLPLLILSLACVNSAQAVEQDSDKQALLDELRQITEKARAQRAADRWLLQDLDDLLARYDWPWQQQILSEDFSDGDFTRDPRWQVLSGQFYVDDKLGLRSQVREQTVPESTGETGTPSDAELGGMIVGALLKHALDPEGKSSSGSSAQTAQPAYREAEIALGLPVTNAFAIDSVFSIGRSQAGQFTISLFQDNNASYGYRLRVSAGSRGHIELERIRNGRAALIDSADLGSDPADGYEHELIWRQAPDGTVTIELDDEALISIQDRAFRDGYNWLVFGNQSGDVALRSLTISGT